MKRLLILLCVAGFLAALPLSHVAVAKKPVKVEICHVNSANDIVDLGGPVVIAFGKVIEVSPNAVPAHEAHGDSTKFFYLSEEEREELEEISGVNLSNADCGFFVFVN